MERGAVLWRPSGKTSLEKFCNFSENFLLARKILIFFAILAKFPEV
jgi:hypothetical protein